MIRYWFTDLNKTDSLVSTYISEKISNILGLNHWGIGFKGKKDLLDIKCNFDQFGMIWPECSGPITDWYMNYQFRAIQGLPLGNSCEPSGKVCELGLLLSSGYVNRDYHLVQPQ